MEKKRHGGGRARKPSLDAIEKKLGVTRRQARRLEKRGVKVEDLETIEAARLHKLKREAEMLEEKIAIIRREHVPAAKVREDALAAFSVLRQSIVAQEVQLPPLLEGLTAKEMRTVLAGHGERMLKDLSERLATIA